MEISRHLGICNDTTRKWIARHEETGSLSSLPRAGVPRKTTVEEDRALVAACSANPMQTATKLLVESGLGVSTTTVRRRLHEGGRHHHSPAVKEVLTAAHIAARLQFAQTYV